MKQIIIKLFCLFSFLVPLSKAMADIPSSSEEDCSNINALNNQSNYNLVYINPEVCQSIIELNSF